jgi:hypothetical protein
MRPISDADGGVVFEPDEAAQLLFQTYEQAWEAWCALPDEQKQKIDPPRQSHGCWIFDKSSE